MRCEINAATAMTAAAIWHATPNGLLPFARRRRAVHAGLFFGLIGHAAMVPKSVQDFKGEFFESSKYGG